MIAVARGIGRFDGRSAFTTWLYRVATNAALDELRRRKARRPTPVVDPPAEADSGRLSPEDEVGARLDVDAALARRCPRSSGSPWSCATCATSTTPRSPRCSACRRGRCARASPVAGRPLAEALGNRGPARGASYHRDETDWRHTDDLAPDERDAGARRRARSRCRPLDRSRPTTGWSPPPLDECRRRRRGAPPARQRLTRAGGRGAGRARPSSGWASSRLVDQRRRRTPAPPPGPATTEAGPAEERGLGAGRVPSAEAVTGVRDLGELGDVTDAGELRRRVRTQLDEAPASSRGRPPPCLERAVAGSPAPTAHGTGTHRRPVRARARPAGEPATDPPSCCSTRGRAGRSRSSTWPESSRPSAGTLAGFSDGTKEP